MQNACQGIPPKKNSCLIFPSYLLFLPPGRAPFYRTRSGFFRTKASQPE